MLADPVTELTLAMEVGYFQLNRAEYFTTLTVKIPGSELTLAKKRGADHTIIDFIGEIKDSYGTTVTNLRDKVDVKLNQSVSQEWSSRPIEYDTGFTLLPGRYKIKFLARDAVTGRMGTYVMDFVVPNLTKEQQRMAISSVILSSQRVELRDVLYEAGKDHTAHELHPLVYEGQKLIPSVTRVFSKMKELYVYLQAYQPEGTGPQPVYAFVSFYRGEDRVMETTPLVSTDFQPNRLKTTTLRFRVPLKGLAPGEYTCQVSVLDPKRKKAAFWRTPVMLAP